MAGSVEALQAAAASLLPEPVYTYFSQGAADGVSASEAVEGWRAWRFRPHVLCDVSETSLDTTLLGTTVAMPLGIAPTSLQRHAHPKGESEMARGAAAAGALLGVSSNAGQPFAMIAEAGGPWWVQAYVLRERRFTEAMLARAVDAGARAVILTVDTPVVGAKRNDCPSVWDITPREFMHANEDLDGADHGGVEKDRDLAPAVIAWLAKLTGLPVVIKGVLRPDDASRAVEAGAAAVWVSNHGGRQLDRSITTAAALRDVVTEVGGRAEVYVDGGVRDGRDVLVALALGARAVFLGRPALWALTVGGSAGVTTLLDEMAAELREALLLCGVRSVSCVERDLLVDAHVQRK